MLTEKPRDAQGATIPHDHEEIKDTDSLIRGITENNIRNNRISKSFFQSSSDPYCGLSADLDSVANDRSYTDGKPYIGAIKFSASTPRESGLLVGYDRIDGNPHHCQIWNFDTTTSVAAGLTTGMQKRVCSGSTWHSEVPDVTIMNYPPANN